jgi:hypothetical protein
MSKNSRALRRKIRYCTRFAGPGEDMSRHRFSTVLFLALSLQAAGCGAALAAAIEDPDMVVLPDPDLSKAARFPAGAATAGEAQIGPALDTAEVHARGCSALNPCAVTQPMRQQLSKNRRVRRAG